MYIFVLFKRKNKNDRLLEIMDYNFMVDLFTKYHPMAVEYFVFN